MKSKFLTAFTDLYQLSFSLTLTFPHQQFGGSFKFTLNILS